VGRISEVGRALRARQIGQVGRISEVGRALRARQIGQVGRISARGGSPGGVTRQFKP
jgi:hypothetical protein